MEENKGEIDINGKDIKKNLGLIALSISIFASTLVLVGHVSTTVEKIAEEQSRVAINMLKRKMDDSFEKLAKKCGARSWND